MSKHKAPTILSVLETHFGHTKFRSREQEEAVMTLMEGRYDVFVSMPTGKIFPSPVFQYLLYIC